jgi:hypothetical protein
VQGLLAEVRVARQKVVQEALGGTQFNVGSQPDDTTIVRTCYRLRISKQKERSFTTTKEDEIKKERKIETHLLQR